MICKRTVLMQTRCLLIVLVLAVFAVASAGAEGVLPSLNQLFGTAMPSVRAAIGRTASETADTEQGIQETYDGFTYAEYHAFGAYLAGAGARLEDSVTTDSAITVTLSVRGASMEFVYDWSRQTATVVYPSGTRPETEKENVEIKASMLPAVEGTGRPMLSLGEALGRYPDEEIWGADGDCTEVFRGVTETDFQTFSVYLDGKGATLAGYQTVGRSLSASIQADGETLVFTYDTQLLEARVTYPGGTYDAWLDDAKTQYVFAVQLADAGKAEEGYAALLSIPEYTCYKPAAEYLQAHPELEASAREAKLNRFRTIGNEVTFGAYPQTSSGTDSTAIEWIVLEVQWNKALLISRYGLDAKPYNEEEKSSTWENCTLRTWLNGEFFSKAFTAEEQRAILTTTVDNSASQGYSRWSADGGNETNDKLFLLSYAEAYKYFGVQESDENIQARVAPTAYAIGNGAYLDDSYLTSDGMTAGWWWLRSPGSIPYDAALVSNDGSLHFSLYVSLGGNVVRPAFWLDLESDFF